MSVLLIGLWRRVVESLLENIDIEISYDSRMCGIKHDISIVRCASPVCYSWSTLGPRARWR